LDNIKLTDKNIGIILLYLENIILILFYHPIHKTFTSNMGCGSSSPCCGCCNTNKDVVDQESVMKRIQTSMTANFSDVHGGLSGVSRRQDEIVALQKEIIDMLRKAKADKAKAD
jgi:hypothetical protein